MLILVAGLIVFFAVHSISIVDDAWRDEMAARLGVLLWQGLYSLAALAGLLLIIWGYIVAQQHPVILYTPPAGSRYIAALLMLPFFPLLIATYMPSRIRRTTRHPMLIATMLWGATHLLATGTMADFLLFGSFFVWAAVDRFSMSHRTQRPLYELPAGKYNDLIAIVAGLGLYVAFLFGVHDWLFNAPLVR